MARGGRLSSCSPLVGPYLWILDRKALPHSRIKEITPRAVADGLLAGDTRAHGAAPDRSWATAILAGRSVACRLFDDRRRVADLRVDICRAQRLGLRTGLHHHGSQQESANGQSFGEILHENFSG